MTEQWNTHRRTHTLHLSIECYLCSSASASAQQGRDHYRLKLKRKPTTLILHHGYKDTLAPSKIRHFPTCDSEVN